VITSICCLVIGLFPGISLGLPTFRVSSQDGRHRGDTTFFTDLKKVGSAGDKNAVARDDCYPITVSVGGTNVKRKSGKDFVTHYDHIFSEKTVSVIEKQTYAAIFANGQGIMIGDGESWNDGICLDHDCTTQAVKIVTINSNI
jgi:hypothetical protein